MVAAAANPDTPTIMRPSDDRSGELMHPDPRDAVPVDDAADRPGIVPRTASPATIVSPAPANVAEIAGMLLPTEYVSFASSPHPIILLRPVVEIVVICIALAVALAWETHPIVRGHHVTVPLLTGIARTVVLIVAALLALRAAVSLAGRVLRYFAYRVVTTNRRVFVVEGLFGRRVTPLGNTALAGATMWQGMLGRIFGFGNVFLGGGGGALRDMRDPVRLYREVEAVANGVEGDTWKQAVRQTLIP